VKNWWSTLTMRASAAEYRSLHLRAGVRESSESGPLALLVPADHAAPYPASRAQAGHHETNRLAYFSPYVFDAASIYWCGTEDHAGTAASFDNSCDSRHIHAGSHNGKAKRAESGCCALVPRKNAGNVSSAWKNLISCTYFVPFCAHAKMRQTRPIGCIYFFCGLFLYEESLRPVVL
jgi:hypothetical protein